MIGVENLEEKIANGMFDGFNKMIKQANSQRFEMACEEIAEQDSKNVYLISNEILHLMEEKIFEIDNDFISNKLKKSIVQINQSTVNAVSSNRSDTVSFYGFENIDFDFVAPHKNQIIIIDCGKGVTIRSHINFENSNKWEMKATSANKDEFLGLYGVAVNDGVMTFLSNNVFVDMSKNPLIMFDGIDEMELIKLLSVVTIAKILFDRILHQGHKYEIRKATKQMKKRDKHKVQTPYRYISLDYASLDEVKNQLKYDHNIGTSSEKSPHDRRSHIRKYKNGKEVVVKSSHIKGGSGVVTVTEIK